MAEITPDKIKSIAIDVIESEIPEFDYGYEYAKDASLAFMYKVEGIIDMAKRLSKECGVG